jgi:hypothetical protein
MPSIFHKCLFRSNKRHHTIFHSIALSGELVYRVYPFFVEYVFIRMAFAICFLGNIIEISGRLEHRTCKRSGVNLKPGIVKPRAVDGKDSHRAVGVNYNTDTLSGLIWPLLTSSMDIEHSDFNLGVCYATLSHSPPTKG